MAFFDFLKKIDINEGVRLCSETEGAVLLDVREADEYNNRHIPNAVNLPLSMIRTAEKTIPDKNTPLFVYCLSGARSGQAYSSAVL